MITKFITERNNRRAIYKALPVIMVGFHLQNVFYVTLFDTQRASAYDMDENITQLSWLLVFTIDNHIMPQNPLFVWLLW